MSQEDGFAEINGEVNLLSKNEINGYSLFLLNLPMYTKTEDILATTEEIEEVIN